MSDFVTVQLSPIFSTYRKQVEKLQDDVLFAGAKILRGQFISKMTTGPTKFFDTGAALQSTAEEFNEQGFVKSYSLAPTAFYAIFGEYGTGRLGALTGGPAPRGYRYGPKPGMRARRFGRTAIADAKPEVTREAIALTSKFAEHMTTT